MFSSMPVNDSCSVSSVASFAFVEPFHFPKSLSNFCHFNDGDSCVYAADADAAPASLNALFSSATLGFNAAARRSTL